MHCPSSCKAHFGTKCNPDAKGCVLHGKMRPDYYAGVDPLKTGDELITAERDRQVNEGGRVIARDLAMWNNEELENSAISLLTGTMKHPTIWGDNVKRFRLCLTMPMQERRVIAGALICAQIDVDNLKHQILINEQKNNANALRGDEKG